ncbi:MAG: DUF1214 domain-containing protein [Myxococcota bacterium]
MAEEERAVGGYGSEFELQRLEQNSEEVDAKRLMSGAAWEDFCDRLKAAGRHVLAETAPDTPLDRSEGFRYLANLSQAGIRHVFNSDPLHPRFIRHPDSTSKYGAENADNLYHFCRIRSDRNYKIRGRRNSAFCFLIESKQGYMQLGDMENYATLDSEAMQVEADGSFEITLSREPQPGNWMELHPNVTQVIIRQYLVDWERDVPADFEIFDLGSEGFPQEAPTPSGVARQLDEAAHFVDTTIEMWNEWMRGYRERRRDGVLAPAELYAGGADDIRYGNDGYKLTPDEALLIEAEVPDARYWHFQLVDLWLCSNDYANRQSSLNHQQLHIDSDGRVRVVLSVEDPGVPNWLDTGGHLEGIIQYRYIWTRNNPQPSIRALPLAELRAALPADHPSVSPEERRAAIASRQAHLRRREPLC